MTHGSGFNFFIENMNSINFDLLRKKINTWSNINYASLSLEEQYRNIRPQIIIEEFLQLDPQKLEFQFFLFQWNC